MKFEYFLDNGATVDVQWVGHKGWAGSRGEPGAEDEVEILHVWAHCNDSRGHEKYVDIAGYLGDRDWESIENKCYKLMGEARDFD